MSADIVNLRSVRKRKAREEQVRHAEEQRIRFGRTRAEKALAKAEQQKIISTLNGHRLKPGSDR